MKRITFSRTIVWAVTLMMSWCGFSQNLLNNGDFELGFNIGHQGGQAPNYIVLTTPYSGTTAAGNWTIFTNPQPINTASFITSGDHTTGSGQMMIIDGTSVGGQQRFWKAGNSGGGVCGLTVGVTYTFSYWIRSIFTTAGGTLANIGVQFNNANNVTLVSGSATAPTVANGWRQVVYTFTPTNACVNIELYNNNTDFAGNDFAVDDFSLTAPPVPLSISYTATNPTCQGLSNGSIAAYGNNGVTPYGNYVLTGAASQTNATGFFTGLAAGTYTVSVTDSAGTFVSQTNIVLTNPTGLTVSSPVSICSGASTTLTASGGATGYTWTANPSDTSLTTPNIANPVVSPTQPTTYTVTSSAAATVNLIANGNFSNGNIGFDTDYTFYAPSNPTFAQKAYGIVINPNTWEPGFSAACVDHTTGGGFMMVVDGSTFNSGNDLVWGQTVAVTPGQNYTFSYWLQTVAPNNPAVIRTVINGTLVGTANASATVCGWTQYTYVWNSGASTSAQIQLFNSNTNSSGNDFALDDIAFTTSVNCNLSASVTVNINTPVAPTIVCGTATPTSQVFNWTALTGATGYAISYSINGGGSVNVGTITATTFTVTPITSSDSVSLTVTPSGSGCFTSATKICGVIPCPPPTVSVTQQPTCAVPTGTIVFTDPVGPSPLPIPSDLFISEVTDESSGALSYVEIFNGTGAPINLANYKLKVYNNGNAAPSNFCDFALSGTLNNNDVYVVGIGSATNQGGVVPDLVVSACPGFNTNDNVRLATITDVEFDLWGRTDGVDFTPLNQSGYTYRRLATAPHPSMIWNPADWTPIDPQDYTEIGAYTYQTATYEYSVNGVNYQTSPTFTGLAPGTYNVTVRDLVSGCVSSPIALVVNAVPTAPAPTVAPVVYCQNTAATPLTATPSTGGVLNWYGTNATGGTASATAPTPSTTTLGTTTYYVSQTVGGCESPRAAITVTVNNQAPSTTPFLFCDTANSTPTSVAFDFNNVGQTSFSFSYTIDGGTPVTGTFPTSNGSNYTVTGVSPGQVVVLTITWNGICTPPLTSSTVVPTFNQLGPYCAGQTVPALPAISINNKTGTWSPATIDNTTTTTYTFTPNPEQCASRTSMTIVINPNVVPTFNAVAPICSGQTLAALPTTSTNGITGTWSPALNNTATTTYTFTPTAGQCASTTTLTITVNPNVLPTFTAVAPICSGQTLGALPTTSNNGFTGTWSPALNNTATTTYTFTPTANQCASTATLSITVNPIVTPTFNAVTPICSGQTLTALPTTSNNGISGTWSPTLNNTATTTYTFTPTAGQCASTTTLTITVNPNVLPTFTPVAPICSGQTLAALPTISNNGISGTWTPALNNTATTTYTFTPINSQCATSTTLTVTVNVNVSPTFTAVAPICSGQTLAALPTTSNNGITGTWSPAINNTATTTYTFTPTAGQCALTTTLVIAVTPRVTPTFTAVSPVCNGGVITPLPTTSNNGINGIWSPAPNNTTTTTYTFTPNTTECANNTTLQIIVIPLTDPIVAIVESCNANTVTVTSPVGNNYEYAIDGGTYQTSPVFFNLSVGNHTIVAHEITGNCFSNAVAFNINPTTNDVVVTAPQPIRGCDFSNDGFIEFNLNQVINAVTGGAPYVVTFHETITDANTGATPIIDVTAYENINPWLQTIYIRVLSNTTGCYEVVPLQLIVDPTPEATTPNDYVLCDYVGAAGFESFDLTTTVPQILGSIDPSTHTVTFHTSLGDAQGDIGAIANVTGYVTATTTLYVRVENNITGCYDVVSLNLIVNALPNATQPNYPQYTLCDYNGAVGFEVFNLADQVDDILLGQTGMAVSFYPSLTDAQNNTNEITNLQYQNQDIYVQTLGIRITNSTTGCYVISTMDIRVVPLPTPIPPTQPYTICDDNQDGVSCDFDLLSLVPAMLNGLTSYTITFHETLQDAELGNTAIDTSVPYCSIIPFLQTIYVRAVDNNTGCWSVIPIVLEVNPSPIAPVNLNDIVVCDQDNNTQNGFTLVDLTIRTPDVLVQQPLAASNYTVTYYTSSTAAELGTSPIIPATNFLAYNGQPIWVRVENNTTGCFNIGTFDVIINMPLLLTVPTPLSLCDDDANPNDGFHSFDLTVRDVMITQGLSGYTVTYYPSLADANSQTNAITNPTAYTNVTSPVQTLGVRVTSAAGCYSVTTLDIRVLPIPTPNTNPPSLGVQCDYNNPGDMLEYFDLTVNAAYILNNDPNLTLEYYNSQADAINQVNPITNPTNALVGDVDPNEQSVWIRVENNRVDYLGNNCYVLVEQPLTVNPLPTVATIADYQICEADPSGVNDGFEVFDLTSQITALMANNPTPPTYTVRFYEDAALTIPINNASTYTNLTNPQTIYVQITNDATTCRSVVGQFNILVNPKPTINIVMADMLECDYDGVNDGLMLYTQNPTNAQPSLAGYVDDILGAAQTAPTYIVEFYYNSQADAEAGNSANALTNLDTYQVQTGTYWIRVTNTVTGCYQLDSFEVVIEKLAEPVITSNTGSNIACVNWNDTLVNNNLILDSGITAPNYTFNWYADGNLIPGANSATYPVTDINADSVTYTVEAVSVNPPLLGCVSVITAASTFEVVRSGSAANIAYTVTNAFEENQIITVTNDGYGIYEYSLDDGPRQASNVFENVSLGSHTIYVWDVRSPDGYSCGVVSIENVQVIDYPRYFTPNGDGFHDTWNVSGLQNFDIMTKIYIFDRYGKLLKQLSASGDGWDGTYNGQPLPSTDYWFTVDYPENGVMKQFKAHFSLKR